MKPDIARVFRVSALLLATSLPASAQTYAWTAFVGLPPQTGTTDGPASEARFNNPFGIVGDSLNNIYVTEASNDLVRWISPTGVVTRFAGDGRRGAVDGAGTSARFAAPCGIELANGALFVADRYNHAIRRISSAGVVTTFAGRLGLPGSNDGNATSARFNEPMGISSDSAGFLYVADRANHLIRKIAPNGEVTTVAGAAGTAGSLDGPATSARFNFPSGIYGGAGGVLFVADTSNHTIRRISAEGNVTTLAGSAGIAGSANGAGSAARFSFPHGLVAYSNGQVLVCDSNNDSIRLISATGVVELLSGRPDVPGSRDGPLADARFFVPSGIAFIDGGTGVAVADSHNHSIRKLSERTLTVTTIAGPAGNFGRQDGVGSEALFNFPTGVGVHSSGDVYLADTRGNTIRRITPQGVVTTLVTGGEAFYADGPADVARVNYPLAIAVAPDRSVYFCEQQRHTVRVLRPDGSLTTIAGSPGNPGGTDGTGTAARFAFPSGIALDNAGNLYVGDRSNHTIRRIAAGTSTVTTLAGAVLAPGSTDGAGATARFRFPEGVATDRDGNVYVADSNNHAIRKITPAGDVSTIAGLPQTPGSANGEGSAARFAFPSGLAVDSNGQIFVADQGNHTIRKIAGSTVTTIGGSAGINGFFDGTGDNSWFYSPNSVAVDSQGTLYVSEAGNNLVRKGELMRAPTIVSQPRAIGALAGGSASFSVNATGGGLTYQWRRNGIALSEATGATLNVSNVDASAAGTYSVTVTNNLGSVSSESVTLTIVAASDVGRIVNLSILTSISAAGDDFTMGFVVGGSGTTGSKPLVIRAAGPSLGALGVGGTLDDPKLELFTGTTKSGENDNWGGSATLATAMQSVGAFAFTGPTSRDAATTGNFSPGDQSVKVSATGPGTGTVIAEIYDATPAGAFAVTTPRLVNVSVLKHLGSGLTAGFVIGGATSKTILVRAIGPTLGTPPFNVGGVVADPQLTLFSGQTVLARNDNWGGTTALNGAFAQVGAFALGAASRDAAVVATLPPGSYTVEVTGVGSTSGVALVEIYEVP